MITLFHGGGARDFEIIQECSNTEKWDLIRKTAIDLLKARNKNRAADLLFKYNFICYEATNGFNDEFCVLYLEVSVNEYIMFEELSQKPEEKIAFKEISQAVNEVGPYIRFISVSVQKDNTFSMVPMPEPVYTSKTVELALSDSETLLKHSSAVSALDRVHTALHGFFRVVCQESNISTEKDSTLTALFSLIRKNHPAFTEKDKYGEQVTVVLRASASILESLNTIRNRGSVAHPNEVLIGEVESQLFINIARSILHYMDSKLSLK